MIHRSDFRGKGAEQTKAHRVVLFFPNGNTRKFVDVNLLIDEEAGLVQLISRDGNRHLVSAPLNWSYIEWDNAAEIRG